MRQTFSSGCERHYTFFITFLRCLLFVLVSSDWAIWSLRSLGTKKLNAVTTAPAAVASSVPASGVGASASVLGAGAAALAAAATVRPSKRCAKKEQVVRMATATDVDVDTECINAIRFLAVDAVNKANSGHPGAPMGQAPIGYLLFAEEMQYNPEDPKWVNRDRFVLSSGHGCMLQYSLLHLAGYKSVAMDDIKQFRQWGSKTPGHPENFETDGIEVRLDCIDCIDAWARHLMALAIWFLIQFQKFNFWRDIDWCSVEDRCCNLMTKDDWTSWYGYLQCCRLGSCRSSPCSSNLP